MPKRPSRGGELKNTRRSGSRTIATNRRATYDYEILDTVEAGLSLWGTEIKSIRAGHVNLRGSFARGYGHELWLEGVHIAPYAQGNVHNHDPLRSRKLLLKRGEMDSLIGRAAQRGLTIVILRLYLKGAFAKVAIGLGRGKRRYQKKQTLIDRAVNRDIQREMKLH